MSTCVISFCLQLFLVVKNLLPFHSSLCNPHVKVATFQLIFVSFSDRVEKTELDEALVELDSQHQEEMVQMLEIRNQLSDQVNDSSKKIKELEVSIKPACFLHKLFVLMLATPFAWFLCN